ncbi:hypothetical protein DXG03_003079 [Asterophora parasitica]|uniref:MYND-type domain-containing protein n=1 Tax=Asterophora parasitica TaxID=117018 RepID=A0A9P7GH28_9AGAR|nr:hypothetical protein DXG03_003079 [Asterophora parasitica]
MAHPLYWPGKYYFYPIGNTSAVCLTRDLAPEESADMLLLGCGDPRNILYTILSEPQPVNRRLDFTCCDFEPGVLARNVLLFTMISDNLPQSIIWNYFYHLYLDKESHTTLIEQCKKLIPLSDDIKSWNSSPYGRFLKMSTAYTLKELGRHWSLYAALPQLPNGRLKLIRKAYAETFKSPFNKSGTLLSSARSTGPLMGHSVQVLTEQCKRYWKTGVTFSDPKKIAAATHLNPTFAYSLDGEGCNLHYGTDPLVSFHLAPLFGNATGQGRVTVEAAVKTAQGQFEMWCSSFYNSLFTPTTPTIRFFLGEAMAVCRSLEAFAKTSTLNLGLPVAQWKTQLIQLNKDDYTQGGAPVIFNAIETSNMEDHIGLLNLLVAVVPLLSVSTRSPVLYIESLLSGGKDATKEFTERLYTDITVMGLLLGILPVDFLSGFTSRSNVHELLIHRMTNGGGSQFHQVTTWKPVASGDFFAGRGGRAPSLPSFDPRQLGSLLYDMYHDLFEHEDSRNFLRLNEGNILNALKRANLIHYIRESFVLLLKLVKGRNHIAEDDWVQAMDRFMNALQADNSIQMDTLAYNDLCAHLYRHGVYTIDFLRHFPKTKIGRFRHWDKLTPIVRIILVVPRESLSVFEASDSGTPLLQCDVKGLHSQNIFTSVHVAFGRVIPMGTSSNPRVVFEEDPNGRRGTMPLVASFTMPVWLLTDIEPMAVLKVSLSVRSTTGTVSLIPKLGLHLHVFSANFLDESHVHVLPEHPLPKGEPSTSLPALKPLPTELGTEGPALVELDEQCELVSSMTVRITVENSGAQSLLRSGAVPKTVQLSSCLMRVSLGTYSKDVAFPFPVVGSKHKLRVARKSSYIEVRGILEHHADNLLTMHMATLCALQVVVPVYGPFQPDGMTLNPFPVVTAGKSMSPWSIHRLNLSRLPTLDVNGTRMAEWLNPHVGAMMSSRERSLRKKDTNDTLMAVKDTIHSIIVRSSGIQGGPARRLFAFRDEPTQNCDTIIFISDLKFDLHSHTIVCDGYVLPLTHPLLDKMGTSFGKLVHQGDLVNVRAREGEMRAWKLLLPALVERRRTWQHGADCEYKVQGKIPLTEVMEVDPLCGCGKGKDVEGMMKNQLWKPWAPYVTRFALSPLFAVSYLETIGRDPTRYRCFLCRGKGKPKMMTCRACQKVRYCSRECQRKDWKDHKGRCT